MGISYGKHYHSRSDVGVLTWEIAYMVFKWEMAYTVIEDGAPRRWARKIAWQYGRRDGHAEYGMEVGLMRCIYATRGMTIDTDHMDGTFDRLFMSLQRGA